jgi:hypothetical protein
MRMFSRPDPPLVVPPQQTDGILEARRAREHSRARLLDAVDSGIESRQLAQRMRDLRATNHFGPQVESAILKGRKP